MSVYPMSEFDQYAIFDKKTPTWHKHGRYLDGITADDLTNLMTVWEFQTSEPTYKLIGKDGKTITWAEKESEKGVFALHRDTHEVRYGGVKGGDYTLHDPMDWLVEPALAIVDGATTAGAEVISAINLGGGAHVATTVSLAAVKGVDGVDTRPYLSFITGHKIASAVVRGRTIVVCDNTADQALNEGITVKHTKHSLDRLNTDYAATIAKWVEEQDGPQADPQWIGMLSGTPMTDENFAAILDEWCPIPHGVKATTTAKRQASMRENIRADIFALMDDARVKPFAGTLMAGYQALSTHDHYYSRTRGNDVVKDRESLTMSRHTMARYFPTFPKKGEVVTSVHDRTLYTIARAVKMPDLVAA